MDESESLRSSFQQLGLERQTHEPEDPKGRVNVADIAPDVLLAIFFLLRDSQSNVDWDWTILTRVCSSWRNIALEFPRLWSEIYITSKYHLERGRASLERSGNVELNVAVLLSDGQEDGILDMFEGHMWRVRKFFAGVLGRESSKLRARLLEMTQNTKVLTLRYANDPSEQQPNWEQEWITRLRSIQSWNTQLDSPASDSVAFPLSSGSYHGLTRLDISNLAGTSAEPTVWQLMRALERCYNLEYLKLYSVFSRHALLGIYTSRIEERRPTLSHLRTLLLTTVPSACENMFSMFDINEDVHLDVIFTIRMTGSSTLYRPLKKLYSVRKKIRDACLTFRESSVTLESNCPLVSSDNDNTATPDTSFTFFIKEGLGTSDFSIEIFSFTQYPFWNKAETAVISLEEDTSSNRGIMWSFFLKTFQWNTTSLIIKLPPLSDRVSKYNRGLLKTLTSILESSSLRSQKLAQLTIHSAVFSTDERRALLDAMELNSRSTNQTCKISFVGCKLDGESLVTEDLVF